jgi:hypothetical protein
VSGRRRWHRGSVHDVAASQSGIQAGDAGEQRRRGGIDIDADGVDAILDHRIQTPRQLGLRNVVLVLADADGFGVDLDQFGQRVLQAAGNRDGRARIETSRSGNSLAASSEAE